MADRNIEALTEPLYIGNAGNRSKIEQDGTLEFQGNAIVWNDIYADLFGRRLTAVQGSIDYDWDEGAIAFSPNGDINDQDDRLVTTYQMPHDAKLNTLFNFHIHWVQPDAVVRTWDYKYRLLSNGGDFIAQSPWISGSKNTGIDDAIPYVSGSIMQITPLFSLDTTGSGISAIIQVMLTRSDSNAGSVLGFFLDAHYQIDTIGSRSEYVK